MFDHNNSSLAEIGTLIRDAKSVVIISHVRPDGDAVGTQIALGASLQELGKEVILINEDGCPSNLKFLAGSDKVLLPPENHIDADLCIALDTANNERLGGRCIEAVKLVKPVINIDHHITNEGYGDFVYVDPDSPATAQIIYELISNEGFPFPTASRDSLFVGISTDTGSFRYPATTARTYEVGADLLRMGADCGALSSAIYESYPYRRIELLKKLLGNLKMTVDDQVASWCLDLQTKEELSIKPEDSENLSDLIRGIDSVRVAVFFEELKDCSVRVSMRSKDVNLADVSKICSHFGGGGHPLASGARVHGKLHEVEEKVLNKICNSIT
ncbi:MAG: bifunctional oligoribonuclease/PAP phosphatase NrnA [Verrucomicrobiales bacterium]|nr:bifunctional oligoribonuclease/PAP phosphatase NrnA [Verrucomicrobiales bacterium]